MFSDNKKMDAASCVPGRAIFRTLDLDYLSQADSAGLKVIVAETFAVFGRLQEADLKNTIMQKGILCLYL